MLYLLDANVLITLANGYYAFDLVPQFWNWLLYQAEQGLVKIPHEIMEEITSGTVQDDSLKDWVKAHRTSLLLNEDEYLALVDRVVNEGYAKDLNDLEIQKVGRDPILIASALFDQARCVVTLEVSQPQRLRQNRKIPDVCRDLGVASCTPVEFMRALGFTTGWRG